VFDQEDMVKLPNYNAVVRLMISGVPSQPFSMVTIPPLGHPNAKLGDALKRLSAAKYGRPRPTVEKEIFERLSTKPEPPRSPATAGSPFGDAGPASFQPATPSAAAGSSFLDEWLAKRRSQAAAQPSPPSVQPPPAEADGPTDFAKTKDSQPSRRDSGLAGSAADKDEVGNLAELVKQQINSQPNADLMEEAAKDRTSKVPKDPNAPDEINIDEQGNLSYQPPDDKPS
jgi:hypothetical protein